MLKNMRSRGLLVALLATSTLVGAAQAEEVEVIHWLHTGSESAAIQEVAKGVEALGTTWKEIVPPDSIAGAQALFTSRISGGNPPGGMFGSIGKDAIDLGAQGVLRNIRPLVDGENLVSTVPKFALDIASGPGGELYAVPLAFETQNFIWYSIPALNAAGVEPPKSWQEFLDSAPKLKEAGIIPIAVGAQGWQLTILHFSILTSLVGQDGFTALYAGKDAAVGNGDGVIESFRVLRALSDLADEGSANRAWNDTLSLMADGKAGIYVMGSWAGGELAAMGKVYGTEWGCSIAGGDTWILGATGFMIPDLGRESKGQDDFIRALLDPAVQTAFSVQKGSIPTRSDASSEGLSECSKMVAKGAAEGHGVPNPNALLSADAGGQISDLVTNFWSDKSITAEDAAAKFADIVLNDQ